MGVVVTIGGVTKTARDSTVAVSQSIDGRWTAEFAYDTQDGSSPTVGAETTLYWSGVRLFGGTIDEVAGQVEGGTDLVRHQLRLTDYNHILDRRLCAETSWQNVHQDVIIGDICNDQLTDENVDASTYVEEGPLVERFDTAADETVGSALARLAQLCSTHIFVDAHRRLHAQATPGSANCPFSVTDPALNVESLSIRTTREDYGNWVFLRLSQYLRPEDTRNFSGDGSSRVFVLEYGLGAAPTITLNGAAQTVGIQGSDTGKDWYYVPGAKDIIQDDAGTVLEESDTLAVTYIGLDRFLATSANTSEITARAAVENNSGIYQQSIAIDSPLTAEQAQVLADATVAAKSSLPKYVVIETNTEIEPDCLNAEVGQLIAISRSAIGLTGNFLIRKIDIREEQNRLLRYRLECISGSIAADSAQFFKGLGGGVSGGVVGAIGGGGSGTASTVVYDVTDYGATGDGTTDDLAAIEAARDALAAAGGGILWFPTGTYRITDTLDLGDGTSVASPSSYMIRVLGAGAGMAGELAGSPDYEQDQAEVPGAEILFDGGSGDDAVYVRGFIPHFELGGLLLNGNNTAQRILVIAGIRMSHVHDLYIKDGRPGSLGLDFDTCSGLFGDSACYLSKFSRIKIYNCTSGSSGMRLCGQSGMTGTISSSIFECMDIRYAGDTALSGSDPTSYGVWLGNVDNCYFRRIQSYSRNVVNSAAYDFYHKPGSGPCGQNIFDGAWGHTGFFGAPSSMEYIAWLNTGDDAKAPTGPNWSGDVGVNYYTVKSIAVTNPGSGYTSAPTVTITGGGSRAEQATAYARISAGGVASVFVISPGQLYMEVPSVGFSGGGGSGAAATATLGAQGYVRRLGPLEFVTEDAAQPYARFDAAHGRVGIGDYAGVDPSYLFEIRKIGDVSASAAIRQYGAADADLFFITEGLQTSAIKADRDPNRFAFYTNGVFWLGYYPDTERAVFFRDVQAPNFLADEAVYAPVAYLTNLDVAPQTDPPTQDNWAKVRILRWVDNSAQLNNGNKYWDSFAVVNQPLGAETSYWVIRDSGGAEVLRLQRQSSGATPNLATLDMSLYPKTDATRSLGWPYSYNWLQVCSRVFRVKSEYWPESLGGMNGDIYYHPVDGFQFFQGGAWVGLGAGGGLAHWQETGASYHLYPTTNGIQDVGGSAQRVASIYGKDGLQLLKVGDLSQEWRASATGIGTGGNNTLLMRCDGGLGTTAIIGGGLTVEVYGNSSYGVGYPRAFFGGVRYRGSPEAPTSVNPGDRIGIFGGQAYAGGNVQNAALLQFYVEDVSYEGVLSGQLQFWTGGLDGIVKRWTMTSTGKLYPEADGVQDLGGVANRLNNIYTAYVTAASISTSSLLASARVTSPYFVGTGLSAPTADYPGVFYYNNATGKFQFREASGWVGLGASGGSGLLNWSEDANGHLLPAGDGLKNLGAGDRRVNIGYFASIYGGSISASSIIGTFRVSTQFLQLDNLAGPPPSTMNGNIYYNSSDANHYFRENGVWERMWCARDQYKVRSGGYEYTGATTTMYLLSVASASGIYIRVVDGNLQYSLDLVNWIPTSSMGPLVLAGSPSVRTVNVVGGLVL